MKVRDVTRLFDGVVGRTSLVIDRFGHYFRREEWEQRTPVDKDWRDRIRVGDIIREGKTERVVREALYKSNGFLVAVHLVILRCSWTTRCYTVVNRTDLYWREFRPTGKRAPLNKAMDKRILKAIRSMKISLTCCDVEGIR